MVIDGDEWMYVPYSLKKEEVQLVFFALSTHHYLILQLGIWIVISPARSYPNWSDRRCHTQIEDRQPSSTIHPMFECVCIFNLKSFCIELLMDDFF